MRLLLASIGLTVLLSGCHPPDRQAYQELRDCVGVFNVALKRIPHGQLRQAGLYSDDVSRAAADSVDGALKFGANAHIAKNEILKSFDESRARAWRTYGDGPTANLIAATRKCMPKPDGPND